MSTSPWPTPKYSAWSPNPADAANRAGADRPATAIPKARRGLRLLRDVRRDPLGYFTRLMQQEGAFAWLHLGGRPLLMLNDTTGIQHILQDNAENYRKARFNSVLRPLLGDGIFLSEGALWRKQRQESAPAFAAGKFDAMLPAIIAATEAMLRRWEPRAARHEPIDLTLETMQFTLDVLLRALFHEARDGIAADMQKELGILLREAEGRSWSPFNLPQPLVMMTPTYRRAMGFLDGLVHGLIAARRNSGEYPEDLLSRLIANYGLSAADQKLLRDQVISFLLAGHETTAHGLAWSFYCLGAHPIQRQKMLHEVDEVLRGEMPTLDTLRRLSYTRHVFDEALRLYPPVWTMSREALQDDVIPLDDGGRIPLPKDTVVMLCDYAVHRREAYWPDPEAFYPERFRPETSDARPKFAWFPFGGGARLCLGFRFAQIESLTAMSMITQKYVLSLLPGQTVRPLPIITLRPSGPILFHLKPRGAAKEREVPPATNCAPADSNPAACPFTHAG